MRKCSPKGDLLEKLLSALPVTFYRNGYFQFV
jgi:hypothetical protein